MTPTIKQIINQEAIAGHEQIIDKLTVSIGDRMSLHGIGKSVVDALINQDIETVKILKRELNKMKVGNTIAEIEKEINLLQTSITHREQLAKTHGLHPSLPMFVINRIHQHEQSRMELLQLKANGMRSQVMTVRLKPTNNGWLVDVLGCGRDFGQYHDDRAKAWEHFMYILEQAL